MLMRFVLGRPSGSNAVRERHMQGVGAGTADVHGVRACVQLVICFGTSHKAKGG